VHLITGFSDLAKCREDGRDFAEWYEGVESRHNNLGRRPGANRGLGVIWIRLQVLRRREPAGLGKVEIGVDVAQATAFGEPGVRRGSVIGLSKR
jgi:hypothetical protein